MAYRYSSQINIENCACKTTDRSESNTFLFRNMVMNTKTLNHRTGTALTFNVTNIYRNVENPTFVLIAFLKTNDDTQLENSSQFVSEKVKSFGVKFNDNLSPEELQNLHIENGNYAITYEVCKDL